MNMPSSTNTAICTPSHQSEESRQHRRQTRNGRTVRVVSGRGFRYVLPFPTRLHEMLETVEKDGHSHIVSWLPHGKAFKVHKPDAFISDIVPVHFKQKQYKSFQRQLHLYGFQRVLDGPEKGAYFHQDFVRDNRELSLQIDRKVNKHDKTSSQAIKRKTNKRTPDKTTFRLKSSPSLRQKEELTCKRQKMEYLGLSTEESPKMLDDTGIILQGTFHETSINDTMTWLLEQGISVSDLFHALDFPCPGANKTHVQQTPQDSKHTDSIDANHEVNFAEEVVSLFGATTQPAVNEETRIDHAHSQEEVSSLEEDSLSDMEPIPYLGSELYMSDLPHLDAYLDDLFSVTAS